MTHSTARNQNRLLRIAYWLSPKRRISNIETAGSLLVSSEERQVAFEKVEKALLAFQRYSPCHFSRFQRDVEKIYIGGEPSFWGQYVHSLRLVQLNPDYVVAEEISEESIASTLVHEGQHARLYRLGFDYDPSIRARIERLCFIAEKNFGRRLPNGEKLIERANRWLESDLESHFSNEGLQNFQIDALRKIECPEWIIRTVLWIMKRRGLRESDD